jgi:hypothetical protein
MNNTINLECEQFNIYYKETYHIIQITLKLSYRFLCKQVKLNDPEYETKIKNIAKKEEETINKLYNTIHNDKTL